MKRLFNYLFIFLVIVLPFNIFAYGYDDFEEEYNATDVITYSSGSYDLIIDDREDLLTEAEEIKLQDEMTKLLEYGNIAFVSDRNSGGYGNTESIARSYYFDAFGSESGTLFYIDMGTRYIYIHSDGANYNVMKANIITDNIYTYATNENYYECASSGFDQIYTLLAGGKISEPLRFICSIILALITS